MWNKDWDQVTAFQNYESKARITINVVLFHILFKAVELWVLLKGAKPLSLGTYCCCLPFVWFSDPVVARRVD